MAYDRTSGDVKLMPGAQYAVLEFTRGELRGADLRTVPYAPEPLFRAALGVEMPHAEWWISEWG